jgi:ferrochelatase
LVNFIIVPFRSPKTTAAYQKIWTQKESPLLLFTRALGVATGKLLGENFSVEIGMRYGKPSIEEGIHKLVAKGVKEIRILPLYPQYASSTTESSIAKVFAVLKKFAEPPAIQILPPFFEHPGFVKSFAEIGKPILENFRPDHILFSFHGLPERHILKGDLSQKHCLKKPDCCEEIIPANGLCYRAHCFQSAYAIAKELNLSESEYTICFQSRLGRTPWIKPFTDVVLKDLVHQGKKRIAVFCPSFVADCLETLEEVAIRYRDLWKEHGGKDLMLIPSLNDHPRWVEAVGQMLKGEN